MTILRLMLLLVISTSPLLGAGCGSNVSPGVADAPDEPTPELTPDERKAEQEAARAARQ